ITFSPGLIFCDADGDGIPNSLDLDSDNDGIPDVIESGGTDANRDGRADGSVGTSGNTEGVPSSAGAGNTPTATADGDTLPDYLDIDADNDGIPDNIEGQTTNGYVAPSGVGTGITDVNNNGVDDNYEVGGNIGLDPTNTDNIDNPDYQDTDADNDGILDVNENGDGDTFSATDTDGDGLVDVFDDNDDSGISGSTVNDGVTPTTTITDTTSIVNSFGDTDGDIGSGGNVDYRDTPGLDSDNDGIADVDDLDDDNDGILDTEEGYTAESTNCTTINAPVDGVGGNSVQSGQAVAPFPEINDGVVTADEGLAMNRTTHYAVIDLGSVRESMSTIRFDWWQNGSANVNQHTITQVATSTTNTPGTNPLQVNYQGLGTSGFFIYTLNASTQYLLIDMTIRNSSRIEITEVTVESNCVTTPETTTDSDGDGIPNHLDLDSDNDGIPDVIESGGTDADRDGRADGTVGTGVNDNGVPSSAGTGNTPTSSDIDTLPDYLDIDADNDGIPDNIEGQPTTGYIAPSGVGTGITDANNNGVDDNYETGGFVGLNPENTDGTDNPDYIDSDSDNDGLTDLQENNDDDTLTGGDSDGDGLYDIFDDNDDSGISGSTVNDNHNPPAAGNLGDGDNDATSPFGDLDYRDTVGSQGTPMITQVYQVGNERWIEITNVSTVNSIDGNLIKIQLYKNKTGDQTGVIPDVAYTVPTSLAPGKSILFKNASNVIANLGADASIVDNDLLTDIEGGDDIITLSLTIFGTSWADRYDAITSVGNRTSYVRIDETLTTNANYTPAEWVVFVDDALNPYRLLGAGGAERHPHDPLISEIVNSNTDANTLLGLHRINITTRTGAAWSNGYPDRSRFVVIDEDYNHTSNKLSARKLTVNASRKLGITDNLLVVTNDVVLNGDIRLMNSSGASANSEAQFIQTHTSASLVNGSGRLLVDQNSTVPSKFRYNYVGSPVKNTSGATNYTVASVLKDGTNPTNFDGVINASTATGIAKDITFIGGFDGNFINSPNVPIQLADYWMYTYAANGGTRASWVQKRSNTPIPNTDGFIFKGPGRPQNYTFMGIPKDGTLTTTVGGDESYLVANPYASSISVKEFIEDNTNSITGTLYFWEHASESNTDTSIQGHTFAGYIGGYATRTIATGVTAKNATSGSINTDLQAESATYSGTTENITDGQSVNGGQAQSTADIILLDSATDSIIFKNIPKGIDTLRIRYKTSDGKLIRIKENNEFKLDFQLPATADTLNIAEIPLCIVTGSNITLSSTNNDPIRIDYLNLTDDGEVSCAPNLGGEGITYTEPKAYIPIGQGFFVSGDADGGTITFNNSQREFKLEGTDAVFLRSRAKSNANSITNLPVIKLGMDFKDTSDGNEYHRQIAISFSQFTSFAYDKGYDAQIYDIGSTDFYWKFPGDEDKYVIAGVNAISSNLEVPLEVVINYSGDIEIKVDEMKNVTDNVYIIDKLTGDSYDVINGKAKITLENGTYSERFVLAFKPTSSLYVTESTVNAFTNIYIDNKNDFVNIKKNQKVEINKVKLINLLGKTVSVWNIKEQKENFELKIKRSLPAGVYIVKLNSDKGDINKKVIIE
ncbi:T9SS type A sorting domain-containing protein, partial [Polaribacter aquimarinus]